MGMYCTLSNVLKILTGFDQVSVYFVTDCSQYGNCDYGSNVLDHAIVFYCKIFLQFYIFNVINSFSIVAISFEIAFHKEQLSFIQLKIMDKWKYSIIKIFLDK